MNDMVHGAASKKSAPVAPGKKLAKKPSDEDVLLDDAELEAVLDDEDEEDKEDDEAVVPVEAAIAAAEAPIDEDEDEEEEPVNEEEILAKGDELEILNLLAKKANRMEKGLDDDELIPDEEGMGGF